jgi:hypothetical protein
MLIGGSIWVDARLVSDRVQAWIGGTLCASEDSIRFPDGPPGFFMEVPSAAVVDGCGTPGASVQFTIDGRSLDQTVVFTEGAVPPVTLTSGAPFMQISGLFSVTEDDAQVHVAVEPFVDGTRCGYDLASGRGGTQRGYHVVVFSEELSPGCGAPGKMVELELVVVEDDGTRVPLGMSLGRRDWEPGTLLQAADEPRVGDLPYE